MRRIYFIFFAVFLCIRVSVLHAYDHEDTAIAEADPKADITNFFVFKSQDPLTVNHPQTVFIMTVHPNAGADTRFSPEVEYIFNIVAEPSDVSKISFDITCRATAGDPQRLTCEGLRGRSAQTTFGQVNPGNPVLDEMRLFAGLVDDPTFFDRTGFENAITSPENYQEWLSTENKQDSFAGQKNLAIVVDVLNSVFDVAFPSHMQGEVRRISVYASTNRLNIDR